jgi:hypothetical protein
MRSVDSLVLIDTNQSSSLPNLMWIRQFLFLPNISRAIHEKRRTHNNRVDQAYESPGQFFWTKVEIANNGLFVSHVWKKIYRQLYFQPTHLAYLIMEIGFVIFSTHYMHTRSLQFMLLSIHWWRYCLCRSSITYLQTTKEENSR